MRDSLLTILLPLKGRHLLTLRWLWHADKVKMPFHIIVADGDVHPTLANIMQDPDIFPNLSIEYHKYDDKSLSHFYRKCVDATHKVKTPYVMMADNDDFLFVSGLKRSIDFLNENHDYVCSQGGVAGFSINKGARDLTDVTGSIRKLDYRINEHYKVKDINSSCDVDRVIDQLRNCYQIYYGVYRTGVWQTIVEEVAKYDFSSLHVHELFCYIKTVSLGKVHSDASCLSYLRQYGTSMHSKKRDFIYNVIRDNYSKDLHAIFAGISEELAANVSFTKKEIEEKMFAAYEEYIRRYFLQKYSCCGEWSKRIRLIKRILTGSIKKHFLRRIFFSSLFCDGATTEMISAQKKELAEIESTLLSDEFLEFIQSKATNI